ncbi:WXG100 family type VII secretion target [Actinomadura xylanilytica]|uniref:WXG100 family type VII secretion target n=1 Tax=Actinomadura xylanilytica TaxID=887459 RepID=UPI00255B14D7|nr:PE domain-containing protein [Actinomadura xylanilytica]MDL4772861.1 PE domain-containing protein [Actinomadura xylanilytica]
MTADGYTVQPQTLRAAASGLASAGERLAAEWRNLVSGVEGMGAPWGGDDIGMLIGESYTAVQTKAGESFSGAAEDLAALGEKLMEMADNHERAEEEMVGEITSISTALNG